MSKDISGNVAVLDVGLTTQKIVLLDKENPEVPMAYHRLYYPLESKKKEFSSFLKSLFRSYADYMIRTFILTTTAEPLFNTATEAVNFLTDTVTEYIHPSNVLCYTKTGDYVPISEAKHNPMDIVSAGWIGLGKYVAEKVESDMLLVEWSTRSTQFIPIKERKIIVPPMSNFERIKNDFLLFYGVLETNIAHITPVFEYKGEVFNLPFKSHAITADVFLLTNDITVPTYICDTPDHSETTHEGAAMRIRKAFCDVENKFDEQEIKAIAQLLKETMLQKITAIIESKLENYNLNNVVMTGIGSNILFEYLKENSEIDNLLRASDMIDTVELTPAFSIGYLYCKNKA
ncbi:MAG: hypothetical protein ACTSYD_09780 [Candidatus Heimdallarchaeaceae archaeon]